MNSWIFYKKTFLFLFAAAAINFCFPANAEIFCDNGSFQLARAVKLGRGNAYSLSGQAELAGKTELTKEKPCDKNCVSCDKTTGTCSKCASGYYLYENACHTCPQYATCDGSDDFSCPAPQYFKMDSTCYKCSDTIEHCTACSDATKCTECESPYVVSDTGDSCIEPPTCATAAMQNNANVAAATDASSFYAAMDSGKSVILIDGDISGLATTALGSKKLVGPKYFSDIEICKTQTTPTVTFASSSNMTISGGEINQLNLKFPTEDTSFTALSGSGTVKNSSVTAGKAKSVVEATGKITFSGTNKITSSSESSAILRVSTSAGSFEIIDGTTTVDGNASYIAYINEGTLTIASSGILTSNATAYFGVELYGGKLVANGPVKIYGTAAYALQQWGVHSSNKPSMTLNASGNILTSYYSGLYATDGSISINGSTTINLIANPNSSDGSSKTAFNMHEVYSNSVISLTITAPVTVKGLTKGVDSQYPSSTGDQLFYMVGGTHKINSTVESTSNIGKVLINGDSMSMSSSGAILGASYLYGYGSKFSVSAGAKLKLGGTCKKAASSGTLSSVTYDKAVTSPVSPFTGGC